MENSSSRGLKFLQVLAPCHNFPPFVYFSNASGGSLFVLTCIQWETQCLVAVVQSAENGTPKDLSCMN